MGTGVAIARVALPSVNMDEISPYYILIDSSFKTKLDLENVDNTSDLNKPLSTAVIAALALKVNIGGGGGSAVPVQFSQASAITTWNIPHNLGHRPVINVYTTGWVEVVAQIVHIDSNNTQVLFDSPQAGYAVLL